MRTDISKLLILSFTMFSFLLAGAPDTLWTKTYGGSATDVGYSLEITYDGGYIISGYTSSFGVEGNDVFLIRTDSKGDTLWTKMYGGKYEDCANSVKETHDKGFIIAGYTNSFGPENRNCYLLRTDENGDTLWTKVIGSDSLDWFTSVQCLGDSGFIVTGATESGPGPRYLYLVKTNANGDTLWTKLHGGNYPDAYFVGNCLLTTDAGEFIIAGQAPGGPGDATPFLFGANSLGTIIWERDFGTSNVSGYSFSVNHTDNGGFIVTGDAYDWTIGHRDVYLVRTNPNGTKRWAKVFGGSKNDIGHSVVQTYDDGFIIAGSTNSFSSDGKQDIYIVKTDSAGDTLWTNTYGGAGNDYGYSIKQTSDGGFIIAGSTDSFGAGSFDVYLIRLKPDNSMVNIYSPDGGEILKSDSIHTITWEYKNPSIVDHYRLLYTKNSPGWGNNPETFSCHHPYPNNYDTIWTITNPGAEKIRIHFDTINTDPSTDFIYIYDKNDDQIAKYDGIHSGFWTPEIIGDIVKVRLVTDGNIQKYGFNIDKYRIYTLSGDEEYNDTIAAVISPDSTSCPWIIPPGTFLRCKVKLQVLDSLKNIICECKSDSNFSIISGVGIKNTKAFKRGANIFSQNYPNPFSQITVIKYYLPTKSKVSIGIYDLSGKLVKALINNETKTLGYNTITWDRRDNSGKRVTSGIYFYRVQAGKLSESKQVMVIK